MSFKKNAVLGFALLLSHFAGAQTVTQVFDYAQAKYPTLFSGTVSTGTYLQYTYRYYATSKNYIAVDNANSIALLGPATNNVIQVIGPVSAFSADINAWVANPTGSSDNSAIAAAVAIVCTTKGSGSSYSNCGVKGSNTSVSILDPVYNSFKGLTGTVTSSTQPNVSVGASCTLAIETFFGIFVAKVNGTTNVQPTFAGKSTDTISLGTSGAVEKITAGDKATGVAIEVNLVNGGLEYVAWGNSTQSSVCKVK